MNHIGHASLNAHKEAREKNYANIKVTRLLIQAFQYVFTADILYHTTQKAEKSQELLNFEVKEEECILPVWAA